MAEENHWLSPQDLKLFLVYAWHTVGKEVEVIDIHQNLALSKRSCGEGRMWNFINYHIWLVMSPDSIIAQFFQTSLSGDLARGGGDWNSG